MREQDYEKLLHINTSKSETRMDRFKIYNRYEPTPYEALISLFEEYKVEGKDHFVDFGSGKARFAFLVNFMFNSACTSVEISEDFHKMALVNKRKYRPKNALDKEKLFFVNSPAEKYQISNFENKFYFFNPFALPIFISVINNIHRSLEYCPREIDIILYYPPYEYLDFLENKTSFKLYKQVYLDKSTEDPRERFVIYRIGKEKFAYDDYSIDISTNSIYVTT
nr:SAM-dependent methyltransferase [uncultured Peptostreptococcus sp.]